jgi:hypothetical protein
MPLYDVTVMVRHSNASPEVIEAWDKAGGSRTPVDPSDPSEQWFAKTYTRIEAENTTQAGGKGYSAFAGDAFGVELSDPTHWTVDVALVAD